MTSLPNMTVLAPATPLEVAPVMMAAVSYIGPVYIRFGKAFEEEIYQEEPIIEIGKANIIREGKDLTIIVTGSMISDVVKSTELLEQEGIDTEVLNMTTLKPIDKEAIIKSAAKTGRILTVEEHNYYGGLRSLVSDALIDTGRRVEFQSICFQDEFCMQYGWRQNIRKMYGISVDGILETARKMMV